MIPGSANPLLLASAAAAGGYQVQRSLRFNSSDSGFCSRTPAVAGDRTKWTWAGWVKRSALSTDQMIFTSRPTSSPYALFYFTSADYLQFSDNTFGYIRTDSVFRDPSAWYHIVLAVDTTGATAADYLKIYVNNVRQTIGLSSLPTLNSQGQINTATAHSIGSPQPYANNEYFNGYLAEVFFIDGQALTPSSFTEVSATTGQLIPLAYSGSFGTNGFWLKFSDNSAATAATLGKDYSGNSNNWTPNNLSVTAGAGNDSLVDTPTSYGTDTGVGGEVRGNYATLNPLVALSPATLSNGNLDVALNGSASYAIGARGTIAIPTSGKWYWEVTVTTVGELGIGVTDFQTGISSYYYRYDDGGWQNIYINDVQTAAVVGYTNNDVISIGYDADNSQIRWYKNGTQVGTNYSLTNNGRFLPFIKHGSFAGSAAAIANFGQRAFAYTAPSGFKALCDTNLPAPLTAKPNTVMDVALYTGNGGTQTISSLAFSPDFVWLKSRSNAYGHQLYDVVRGAGYLLGSNSTSAESGPFSDVLNAFTSNGFTVGSDTGINGSGNSVVGWAWDAGGTTDPSNTAGSITSQVRANVSAGFSVVTFTSPTGTGNFSAGHGLGVTPEFVIVKSRDAVGVWYVYHKSLATDHYLRLNGTNASGTDGVQWGAGMTSSVLGLRASYSTVSGATTVAYAFAPVVGYSNGFSYTGNGSADGPYIHLGFRTRFLILKRTDASGDDWLMVDTARNPYNLSRTYLYANLSSAEMVYNLFDITANGIKLRDNYQGWNASGGTYVGFAWAEAPFAYSRAR